jgi:hypothetical protein
MTTETVGDKTEVPAVIKPDESAELATLREQLGTAKERIGKYDGERKDQSEQTNMISELRSELDTLKKTVSDAEDEDTKYTSVTQEQMREYKAGEGSRFAEFTKQVADDEVAKKTEYQKYLGEESLTVKDDALFKEICAEHDNLVNNNAMPESTGNLKADAKIAWREAENALYRKKLAAGKQLDFKTPETVTKPIVPGQTELSTPTTTPQTTTMPANLPDDAKEFLALMGDSDKPDMVNKALGR